MKTIGLIGGMSWESTITYYEVLNKEVVSALGGFHSAKILMYSVDFAELEANMSIGNWDDNAAILADAAKRLESAGADFIVIADFIKDRLKSAGLEVIVPDAPDIEIVNNVIFNELCLGKVLDASRAEYQRIIESLKERGAECVILGCTEIGMLISAEDSVLPVYDTTIIHAKEAARQALE